MVIAGILNPVPWIDIVYAQPMYQLPPYAIVMAVEKSVLEYYNSHNKTLAPDFNMYMPGMLKYLDSSMTFTPTHIDYAVNYIMSYPEFVGVYNWNTLYWILVDTLYDRIFPKIEGTIWHPPIYYERGTLIITDSQYKEAAALSNSPKDLLIYAITQIIRNIRSQWKTEPIMSDVLDGIKRLIPAGVTFTEGEIEFATYMINSNPETELIYSYQMWYDALLETLRIRILATEPDITEQLFYATPPAPPTDITPEQQKVIDQQIPPENIFSPAPEEKTGWNYWLIGGAAVAALYLWKKRKG